MDHKDQHLIREKERLFTDDKIPFSRLYNRKLKELNDTNLCKLSKKDIADQLGISVSLLPKYIANGDKATKKRDCVIAMCMMVHMTVDEINNALYKYHMPYLDEANKRDEVIIKLIDKNLKTVDPPLPFSEMDEFLYYHTGTHFDMIEHRRGRKNKEVTYPFTLVKKMVECRKDELAFGDPYDSLETAYRISCHIYAFMWLDDNGKKGYKLCAEPDGILSCTEYPMVGEWYHRYDRPEAAGVFKDCFIELKEMALSEKRKMAEILYDTRNYCERASAKVIENELHVFYETYNYTVPELGEYYLMDHVNGEYTLYVSQESRFMRLYLSKQEYSDMLGGYTDKFDGEKYTSVEMIENAAEKARADKKEIIKLRVRAFCKAQDKINLLIGELISGGAHIRRHENIYENVYDVLSFYGAEDAFQCRNEKAIFSLSDGRQAELSFDDLCAGFELGLSTIDEVGAFWLEHNTLKASELLDFGLVSPKSD